VKVDYDSEAHSLLFEFGEFHHFERGDYTEILGDGDCIVGFHQGRVGHIQVLNIEEDITILDQAAERFDLDAEGLRAGARAALAAPDREISIEVGRNLAEAEQEGEAKAA
jgi:hypothetical protein